MKIEFYPIRQSLRFPRPPYGATGFGAGVLAILENLDAIDENVFHADGILMWFVEGCAVRDCHWVEDNHISEHSFPNEAAVIKAEISRW
jgi:hypothetical protein